MTSNLIVATLLTLSGALDTLDALVRGASRLMAAFLLEIDVWVIVVIIGCTIIVIIVIVIRTARRQ